MDVASACTDAEPKQCQTVIARIERRQEGRQDRGGSQDPFAAPQGKEQGDDGEHTARSPVPEGDKSDKRQHEQRFFLQARPRRDANIESRPRSILPAGRRSAQGPRRQVYAVGPRRSA